MKTPGEKPLFDIALVGIGLVGAHQVTREAEETLSRCRRLFVTDVAVGVLEYLKSLGPEVISLAPKRATDKHRILIYRDMASEVVNAALDEAPVAFVTYGHPLFYCYPSTLIERAAQVLDLKTRVIAGISSLDLILADLGIDPGSDGLQVYEATDVVIRRRAIQDDVTCVLFQAPIALESLNRPGHRKPEDLRLLQDHLLKYYPPGHVASFVTLRIHPLLDSIVQKVALKDLAGLLERGSNIGTLVIPPVKPREIAEHDLAERMRIDRTAGTERRPNRPPIGRKPRAEA